MRPVPDVDNNTRMLLPHFRRFLASASDYTARPGACGKPRVVLYSDSGKERVTSFPYRPLPYRAPCTAVPSAQADLPPPMAPSASSDHPLASCDQIPLTQLRDEPMVALVGSVGAPTAHAHANSLADKKRVSCGHFPQCLVRCVPPLEVVQIHSDSFGFRNKLVIQTPR